VLTSFTAVLLVGGLAAADPPSGTQIPTIINIYKDSGTTKQEAKDAVQEANKLMKQAGYKLVVVEVNELDKEDPEMDRDDRDKAREEGAKELKTTPNEKGIKINFTKKPTASNSRGVAVHRDPTIIIRESTASEGGAEDTGQTIAHELGHAMTIVGHSNGADDIMHATGKGKKFTKDQIEEMQSPGIKYGVGKCASQWDRAYPAEKDKQQFGVAADDRADQTAGASSVFDINRVVMSGLDATDQTGNDTANIHAQFTVGGILETESSLNAQYDLLFDTDADAGTGDASGFERLVRVTATGNGSGTVDLTGNILDAVAGTSLGTFNPIQSLEYEFTDFDDGLTPDSTSLLFEIPKNLMNFTAVEVPALGLAGNGSSIYDQTTDLVFDLERWLDDPTLQTFGNGVPTYGEAYPFAVSGLAPDDTFDLYLDDDLVLTNTLDATGAFSGSFIFNKPVNDIYFLTAQDSTGEFGYSITCVPLPAALPAGLALLAGASAFRTARWRRAA